MSETETDVPVFPARRKQAAPAPAEEQLEASLPQPAQVLVTVPLEGVFLEWLTRRAAAHKQEPGDHAAGLLRQVWATDRWRFEGMR